MSLKDRLCFDAAAGTVHDGPRRYLLMRPDVLMGMFRRLEPPVRASAMDALAASIQEHGADSLRAYLAHVGGDVDALLDATAQAAADLGWGRWHVGRVGHELELAVTDSPFVAGYGVSVTPVCAPVRGMFAALAALVMGQPVHVQEHACAATGAAQCAFTARAAQDGAAAAGSGR